MKNKFPIRILQIIGIVCGGGVESVIMNYYRHIDREKIQFDFVIDGKEKSILDDEIKSLGGRVYHVTPYKENILKYMLEIYKIAKDNKYEIVHDNMNAMAVFSLFPLWFAQTNNRILHNHTTNEKAYKEKVKYVLKYILRPFAPVFANRYMACSKYAAKWIYRQKSNKAIIVNNAVDIEKFAYSSETRKRLRKELGITDDVNIIGHVGRLSPQKNHIFLLNIFALYEKENHNSALLLIGDGPLKKEIERKVKELNISDKVYMLGLKNNVNEWYSAMDLFVLPSLYEGLPVVAVEAQANGLPVCLSTAITEEAIICPNAAYIDLTSPIQLWVDKIESLIGKRIFNSQEIVANNGFSIKKEAVSLEKMYVEFLHD